VAQPCRLLNRSAGDRRLPPQFTPIYENDLTLTWPILCVTDETRANRIVADICPVIAVAFVTAHNVIEKAKLPKWLRFEDDCQCV
jgi:hypothetical protein